MANSRLPQQLDIRSERWVEVEYDSTRNITRVNVDGYIALLIRGAPKTTVEIDGKKVR